MTCPNCNTVNSADSKFCIGCGNKLEATTNVASNTNVVNEPVVEPTPNVTPVVNEVPVQNNTVQNQAPVTSQQPTSTSVNTVSLTLNYFMYCLLVLLKPNKVFKEEENKLTAPKNAFILSIIVSGVMMLINLITQIIKVVRVESYSFSSGTETTWNFENLKELNYLELIGKNFLIYFVVILGIAGLVYIASLIVKKQTNFIKMLSISATAMIPVVLGHMVVSPILSLIWAPLGVVVSIVSVVYAIVLLYELLNNELKLEGDIKVYYNLAVFAILAVAGYYAYTNLLVSEVSSELDDLMNMFNY